MKRKNKFTPNMMHDTTSNVTQGRIGGKMDEANKSAFPFYTLLPQKEEATFKFPKFMISL